MGQLTSRYRKQGIPVYVSIDGPQHQPRVGGSDSERGFASRGQGSQASPLHDSATLRRGPIVETYELRPLKVIKPRFNAQYSLNYFRYEPPNIIIGYPGIPDFNCGLTLDRENTFKEGHTLNITFRVRDSGPTSFREIFEWHPDLTCISIKLIS
jgi:hypothetical protein